ncbi:MAG: GIY-YIG nuclease family protein [Candidatus Brocadiales bacterium]
MDYYVYVLQSKSTGKIYIGQTSELTKRVAQHNDSTNKLTKYTKINDGPWRLIYHETWRSRTEAKRGKGP